MKPSPAPLILDHRTKGIPGLADPFPASGIASRKWNALAGDVPLPFAILRETVLARNSRWIMDFVSRTGASLCPHGKTTMCPQIFHRQLADGAWGITLSTPHQVQTARDFGVGRILLANQLIDPTFIDFIAVELARDPNFDFYCLVDSVAGVRLLNDRLTMQDAARPIQVLLEVGMLGGRTGCRTLDEALEVGRAVQQASHLRLRGVEGFEGIVPETARDDPTPVRQFLRQMQEVAIACEAAGLFAEGEVILSAGGSAYYDIVVEMLRAPLGSRAVRTVLRSGCYVAHDSSMYVDYFSAIRNRSALARDISGSPESAIAILAYVQSRPEPSLAILTAGKRDCSYDHRLPIPEAWFRRGSTAATPLSKDFRIEALNDQHAYMRIPPDSPIAVGDIVMLGISHPCTTFDKWDVLYGVDDSYNIVEAYKTYF